MTAQGIMNGAGSAMNATFSGFPAVGGSVKGMQETSFEQFMETSKSEAEVNSKAPTDNNKGVKESSVEPKDVKERAKEFFSGESKVKEAQTPQTEETVEVSEETVEAVSTLLVQVQQIICETLGITDEQLTQAMEELGFKDADLLDKSNLQQVFLHLEQAEPTEFLTNETLFQDFAELVQVVEQAVETSGLTNEEVQTVLNALEEEPQTLEPEVFESTELSTEQTSEEETVEEDAAEPQTANAEAVVKENSSETKTETGGAGDEKHMAQAKKDGTESVISTETDVNVKNVFIDALASHVTDVNGETDIAAAAQVREIANQIMEQIRITIRPEQTNMELQLNPEHLGRVNLTITEKEGMMTAQFTTQTEVAKEAIESQMAVLRESLQNQGIKVEAIEVTVAEFGFAEENEANKNGNGEPEKRRKSGTFTIEETEEAAPQTAEYLNVTDSSVDYSA